MLFYCAVLLLSFAVHGSQAQEESVTAVSEAELLQEIQGLYQKLDRLERTLDRRLRAIEAKLDEGQQVSGQEVAAEQALRDIQTLNNQGQIDQAKKQLLVFMGKYRTTQAARRASRLSQELFTVGKDAPQEWLVDKWLQGKNEVELTSGSTKLLVFWEVWCQYCRQEVPKVQAMYSNLKEEGLQVVGLMQINKNTTEAQVLEFMAQQDIAYPVAKEDGSLSAHFNVSGIPAAALVKEGKVVWRGHPARLSEAEVRKWL
jgi:thiol-disulfide isomerase/thioredoxin